MSEVKEVSMYEALNLLILNALRTTVMVRTDMAPAVNYWIKDSISKKSAPATAGIQGSKSSIHVVAWQFNNCHLSIY
jgi:hypothetical protein